MLFVPISEYYELYYSTIFHLKKKQRTLEQLSTSSFHCSHFFLHRKEKKNIYIHIFDRKFAQFLLELLQYNYSNGYKINKKKKEKKKSEHNFYLYIKSIKKNF